MSGQLPKDGTGGSAPPGQSELYIDPNNIPPEMAEAAEFAGFKRSYDSGDQLSVDEDGPGTGDEESFDRYFNSSSEWASDADDEDGAELASPWTAADVQDEADTEDEDPLVTPPPAYPPAQDVDDYAEEVPTRAESAVPTDRPSDDAQQPSLEEY